MSDAQSGQVSATAADVYEAFFLPALFAEPARLTVDAADLRQGQRVLDVACGTGVVARAAASRVGADAVTGIDLNPGMLIVARRKAPEITWQEGKAEALPYDASSFDSVFCQFGLMFFADREQALREMWRVLRPGGVLAVSVWDKLETSPGYAAMTELLDLLFGERVANALRAPFALGDKAEFATLLQRAGVPSSELRRLDVTARFPSLEAWMHTDIRGWTLSDMIDDAQYEQLLAAAKKELAPFVSETGAVSFAAPAHLALARKP